MSDIDEIQGIENSHVIQRSDAIFNDEIQRRVNARKSRQSNSLSDDEENLAQNCDKIQIEKLSVEDNSKAQSIPFTRGATALTSLYPVDCPNHPNVGVQQNSTNSSSEEENDDDDFELPDDSKNTEAENDKADTSFIVQQFKAERFVDELCWRQLEIKLEAKWIRKIANSSCYWIKCKRETLVQHQQQDGQQQDSIDFVEVKFEDNVVKFILI